MELVIVIVAVVVLGLAAMVAAGKFGEMKAEPVRDVYQPPIPEDRKLDADDLEDVRFAVQARGYDMAEVDDLMARMARELDERDRRISELGQGRVPTPAMVTKEPGSGTELVDDDAAGAVGPHAEDEDTPAAGTVDAEPSAEDPDTAEPDAETRQQADRWRGKDEDENESDWAPYRPGGGGEGSTRADA